MSNYSDANNKKNICCFAIAEIEEFLEIRIK